LDVSGRVGLGRVGLGRVTDMKVTGNGVVARVSEARGNFIIVEYGQGKTYSILRTAETYMTWELI